VLKFDLHLLISAVSVVLCFVKHAELLIVDVQKRATDVVVQVCMELFFKNK